MISVAAFMIVLAVVITWDTRRFKPKRSFKGSFKNYRIWHLDFLSTYYVKIKLTLYQLSNTREIINVCHKTTSQMYIKINSNIKQYLPVDVRILQRIFGPSTNRRCNKSKILLGTHKGLQCHVSLVQLLLDVYDYPTVMFF